MSERDKILTACGWMTDAALPLIAERIVNHSAGRIAELEANEVPEGHIVLHELDYELLNNRIAGLEADYKECYQCCTEETIRANEAQATIEHVGDILEDAPELNPSNYDHEGVCELNAKMIEAYLFLRPNKALKDSEVSNE